MPNHATKLWKSKTRLPSLRDGFPLRDRRPSGRLVIQSETQESRNGITLVCPKVVCAELTYFLEGERLANRSPWMPSVHFSNWSEAEKGCCIQQQRSGNRWKTG